MVETIMLQVPLSAVPAQTLSIVFAGQSCQIAVYQKQPVVDEYGVAAGLFFDLTVGAQPITSSIRCLDRTPLLLDRRYLGFVGDFWFVDTTATNGGPPTFNGAPPYYTGLGSQFQLIYLEESDLVGTGE
jgi:hypothetical protein